MNLPISNAGRVCLCEWSGPVTVTMMVLLLSHLKRLRVTENGPLLGILYVQLPAARSMTRHTSPFLNGLPAILGCCQEVAIVCDDVDTVNALSHAVHDALASSVPSAQKSIVYLGQLDDAFTYLQNIFPHEVLELRRRRIRSGTWSNLDLLNSDHEQERSRRARH
jgi:hypothetical protein